MAITSKGYLTNQLFLPVSIFSQRHRYYRRGHLLLQSQCFLQELWNQGKTNDYTMLCWSLKKMPCVSKHAFIVLIWERRIHILTVSWFKLFTYVYTHSFLPFIFRFNITFIVEILYWNIHFHTFDRMRQIELWSTPLFTSLNASRSSRR